jgi:type IV secretory pathway VirJ component
MKRWSSLALASSLLLTVAPADAAQHHRPSPSATPAPAPSGPAANEPTLTFGPFGTVTLYGDEHTAKHVVLFVSGDGGWNLGVVDMARALAQLDSLVVGINIRAYLRDLAARNEKCSYPAADFEALSQFVQKKLGRPSYTRPVLVGYSSGATLVYAMQVQAPPDTFAGALSLGFCPDLQVAHPFCKGHGLEQDPGKRGGVIFRSTETLETPWYALQGARDKICDPPATRDFVARTPNGHIVWLDSVGHGFAKQGAWMPQFRKAFASMVKREPGATAAVAATETPATGAAAGARPASAVSDLPLIELPTTGSGDLLAVVLSGDGGWAGLDKEVGGALVAQGIPVVGWDSLEYYWRPRTPEGAGADLARILEHYLATWKRERVVLIGYSFGAEVAAFLADRLPPEMRARLALVALLGPSKSAQFEFHVTEWLGSTATDSRPVVPEIAKLQGLPVLCLFGSDEKDSICRTLDRAVATPIELGGGHHFGGNYAAVAKQILAAVPKTTG